MPVPGAIEAAPKTIVPVPRSPKLGLGSIEAKPKTPVTMPVLGSPALEPKYVKVKAQDSNASA